MKKKRILWLFLLSLLCVIGLQAQTRKVKLVLVETSDVHGNYFPYDFINNRLGHGSMARSAECPCSSLQDRGYMSRPRTSASSRNAQQASA